MWSFLPSVWMMKGAGVDPLKLPCGQKLNVARGAGMLPTQSFTSRSLWSARTKIRLTASSTWSRRLLAAATEIVCGFGGCGAFGGAGFDFGGVGFAGFVLASTGTGSPNPRKLANTTTARGAEGPGSEAVRPGGGIFP